MIRYNGKVKQISRVLRKNMTESERLLWSRVRMKQLKGRQFYRQKFLGNYIVDFYCPSARLIVQVDGSQHYTQEGMTRDKDQDNFYAGIEFQGLEIFFDRGRYQYRWCRF